MSTHPEETIASMANVTLSLSLDISAVSIVGVLPGIVPVELSDASTESVPLIEIVKSAESTPQEVTSELTKSTPLEATTFLLPSVTVDSPESTPPEVTSELIESVPLEATTVSLPSVTVKSTETSELTESVPLEATTFSLPSVIVESTESTPTEVISELTESVPLDATTVSLPSVTVESIESTPPEVTSELTESVPLEATTISLPSVTVESTESTPPEPEVTSELTESILLEATTVSLPSVAVESTESIPLGVTSKFTENAPPKATTLSLTSVPPALIVDAAVTTRLEVTSESSKKVLLKLTVESTGSAPSDVTAMSTKDVHQEVTNLPIVSDPPKVTKKSAENNIPAAELSTMSSGSVPPLGLTAKSRVQSVPPELTKARDDAERLHRAFEGWGCDETTIIKLIADRSATQRALIRQEYRTKFSEDLDSRLYKKLSGDLKRAVLLWMPDPASRDATLVKQSLGKNLEIAIEVICSRTPSQIEQLKKAYSPMSGSYLEADIESHVHGDTKKLLLAYVGTPRSEGPEVDTMMVDKDAKALYKDGEYKLGTNEVTFIRIFSERSWAHLAKVNTAYRSMYVNSLKKAIKNETSWKFKSGLLTILQCAENPAKYFAKVLRKAMKGIGTDENTLSRIIVSRAEIDIQQIKAEYHKKYKKSLSDVVHSETSGNYRAFLISLLDTNN